MYLLSITGFSPGVGHMGSKPVSSAEALVQHMFDGSWTSKKQQQNLRGDKTGGGGWKY